MVTLVRPQEVVAAIQSLSQAYLDYFGAVADANRAQFRLYRALGQPAQCVMPNDQARGNFPMRRRCPSRRCPTKLAAAVRRGTVR